MIVVIFLIEILNEIVVLIEVYGKNIFHQTMLENYFSKVQLLVGCHDRQLQIESGDEREIKLDIIEKILQKYEDSDLVLIDIIYQVLLIGYKY